MFHCSRSVLTCRTCKQTLCLTSQPGWRWGVSKVLELRIWNFLNGNSCLFKMYIDFILFFNYECQFLVVLIVRSGTSLVPYSFAVLNGCLMIAASVVMSPCTALLNVEPSSPHFMDFFWVFFSGWRWLLHLFVNSEYFSAWENDAVKLIWDLSPVLDSSHFHSNFCLYN